MQTIKPLVLGLTTRNIEFRRQLGLSITGSLYFPFKPAGAGTVWNEMSMWTFLAREMPEGPFIDEGIVKPRSEFLVRGSAFAPNGRSQACEVVAQVAGVQKKLHAFGPRRWNGRTASEPEFFSQVPLDWQHAYGGPDFEPNPLGMGRRGADGPQSLPQVVRPNQHPAHPDDALPPAGFGPIDGMWPQRKRFVGTYDERWLKEQSPGFANDLDWRHFNLASEDQWFDAAPRGDEAFEFVHMHASKAQVGGCLPGFVVRCFTDHGDGRQPKLREVAMRLATLWFFPHAERGIALFQGLAPCAEDDASDIHTLLGAVEQLGKPRSEQHYLDALTQRRDPEHGAIYAIRDSDLTPSDFKSVDPEFDGIQADFQPEGLMAKAMGRGARLEVQIAIDQARAKGIDTDKLGIRIPEPETVPPLEALPEYLLKKRAEALNAQVTAALDAAEQMAAAKAKAKQLGIDSEALVHRGPPTYRAAQHLAELKALVPAGMAAPALDLQAMAPKLVQVEAMARNTYLQTAHTQAPANRLPPPKAQALREAVLKAHAEGQSFGGVDLTGADFSDLDLSGADFTGAWLESASFKGAKLRGAAFTCAVLAHADLSAADASDADFSGANLGHAKLKATRLVKANLSGANLSETPLALTDLRGARLHQAQLHGASFGLADWRSVQADNLLLNKADLQKMVMTHCRLVQPTFVECTLDGVDFTAAQLVRPTFIKCSGQGTKFPGASLEGAVFVDGCNFSGADFSAARMRGSNLRGTKLQRTNFTQSDLDECDLSEADLSDADLAGAALRGAMLVKTNLARARLVDANLMNAIVQRADLRATTLHNANLYGSDLSRVQLDHDTVLAGASLDRAKTYPRREPKANA